MITALCCSSLNKIFRDEKPDIEEINRLTLLRNERKAFQLVFSSDENCKINVSIEGEMSRFTELYIVDDVPVGLAAFDGSDDFFIKKESGMYPDILKPLSGSFNSDKGKYYSIWVEVTPDGTVHGESNLDICINDIKKTVTIDIINKALPEQTLIYTNWYHSDCLADYYNIEVFSDEYWRINRMFIKNAAEHGQNCILTPLFTPALDTAVGHERTTVQLVGIKKHGAGYIFDFRNLKKWIDMCRECGIEYFEMSHFFTQWGAKHCPKIMATDRKGRVKKIFGWETRTSDRRYDNFIRLFGESLKKFISENGLEKNVFFHISDEPSERHLKVYRKRAALIKEVFGDYPVMDALSDYSFYRMGLVDIPVPCENAFDAFFGKVKHVWTYYCCGQCRENVPNRFIAMPSVRNRALGVLLYKYNVEGFLQWGHNFYNSQYSLKKINPFEVTDAGYAFPAGDSFVVYPGEDGSPVSSLRLKVFYDAIQDYGVLKLLESLTDRQTTEEIIGNISFKDYPKDDKWLLDLRETINQKIKALC